MTDDVDLYCPGCDYNLRGLSSATECPECGEAVDLDALRKPQLPWAHRATIGRFRAYWQTVWFVTFRSRRFLRELSRPVDLASAKSFRRVSMRLGAAAILLPLTPIVMRYASETLEIPEVPPLWLFGWLSAWVLAWLFFVEACTGVTTDWFQPRGVEAPRVERAFALAHYTCAPLALVAGADLLGLLMCLVVIGKDEPHLGDVALNLFVLVFVVTGVFVVGSMGLLATVLYQRMTRSGGGRRLLFAVLLAGSWLLAALVTFVLPLAGVIYLTIMVWSLV